jgi:hypothetical protein
MNKVLDRKTVEASGLLDERNSNLWRELNSVHEIETQFDKRKEYRISSQNNKTTIYVPFNDINPASFTHELLHIFLRTKKVLIGGGLQLFINEKPNLSKIFPLTLIEHISNCLEHIKMLPQYLEMDFDRKDFLFDYAENKFTEKELKNLKSNFVSEDLSLPIYNASAISFFIGKYFAVKACPNIAFDYSDALNEMQKLDIDLFSILERFLNAWINFDYNDEDPVSGSYHFLMFDFLDEMGTWINGKQII